MARKWVERDHPRHPGGSGRDSGRFRDKVGSGGWAAKELTEREIKRFDS